MKKYLSYFAEKKKKYPNDMGVLMSFLRSLSKKQIFVLCLLLVAFSTNLIIASTSSGNDALLSGSFKSMSSILSGNEDIKTMGKASAIAAPLIVFFTTSYFIIDIIKNVMSYISKVQIQSVETLGKIDFGSENMFDHIVSAITLFAVIGCVYRLVSHYLKENLPSSIVYRTGGDEFMVICDGKYNTSIIDNIKKTVNVPTVSDKIEISFSIGYAIYDPKGELSLEEAIKLSDKNMYEDKIKNKKNKIKK